MTPNRLSAPLALFSLSLLGCQGPADAATFILESIALGYVEIINEYPANARAAADLSCGVESLCKEAPPLAEECTLDGSIFRAEIETYYADCLLRCDDGFDCVEQAAAQAMLTVDEATLARCYDKAESCNVMTDACRAMPALDEDALRAIDACHSTPCGELRACYLKALLPDVD